ncbi:MAG: type II secretion system protein J [Puniceicoccaceae bacterium]
MKTTLSPLAKHPRTGSSYQPARSSLKIGFTLVELLVAVTITAIISGLMLGMVSYVMRSYNRTSGTLAAISQSSAVLNQLSTDLQSAVFRNTGDVMMIVELRNATDLPNWSTSKKPTGVLVEEDDSIATNRFGKGGARIKFFTAAPGFGFDQIESVRAVAYQILYRGITDATEAPKEYQLYRSMVGSQETFNEGYNLTSGGYQGTSPATNNSTQTLNTPPFNYVIASGTVDFGIRLLYDVNKDGELNVIFPRERDSAASIKQANGEVIPRSSRLTYHGIGNRSIVEVIGDQVVGPLPEAVEVFVRVLTPAGIRELSAFEDGFIADGDWWTLVTQNSEVFSQIIPIPSRPL